MKSSRLLSVRSLWLYALFVLALLAGTGPLSFAQQAVQGTMTLPVAARLGNTTLPPGEYKFTVALIGDTHSIRDVAVANRVYVLLTGTFKDAPTASAIATISPLNPHDPLPPNLVVAGNAIVINALPIPDFGIVVQFQGVSGKEALHTRFTQPAPSAMSAKAD